MSGSSGMVIHSQSGGLNEDLVPWIHMMIDSTKEKDILHQMNLMTLL